MKALLLLAGALSALFGHEAAAIRIATSHDWIEYTPQRWAIDNFYQGQSQAQLVVGGVANLARDNSIDLAANAETQGLKQLSGRRSLRLIYIICEAHYRIVADKRKGIETIEDLRGKRIGTIPGTSAGYFVAKFLGRAGIQAGQYTVAPGQVCMRAPCGQGTFPQMLQSGQIDATGLWETAPEVAKRALGDNAVVFQNGTIYREIYSLYTTEEKLADPAIRADIVEFVRALNETLHVYNTAPETVYDFVADLVGADADVVEAVWPEHHWTGRWGEDLLEFIVEEDEWLSREDRRQAIPRADIEKFLDTRILDELEL